VYEVQAVRTSSALAGACGAVRVCGVVRKILTMRSLSGYGTVRSRKVFARLNAEVLSAMPSPNVSIATMAKPGDLDNVRKARRKLDMGGSESEGESDSGSESEVKRKRGRIGQAERVKQGGMAELFDSTFTFTLTLTFTQSAAPPSD
jgi:hypothetical protein